MGRRNTLLKPRCLVFGPEGFAGASEELAQQLLPMGERIPRKVFAREPLYEQAIGLSIGQGSQYLHRLLGVPLNL